MSVTRREVLRLYKDLVRYSKTLKLTDPVYFKRRVSADFRDNKSLLDAKEITFAFQVTFTTHLCIMNILKKLLSNDNL